MTGGEVVIRCLKENGVRVLFGIPGSHNLPIYDALYHDRGDIRIISGCQESACAFMADGFARASGRVGVCLTTAGPGVANASTGLGEAYGDSVPILLISGEVRTAAVGKEVGAYHEMDLLGFTRPVTKWNARAETVEQIPPLLAKAFEEMQKGRPGPVHLAIPVDVLRSEGSPEILRASSPEPLFPTREAVDKAFEKMSKSRSPLLLLGGGVISAGASREAVRLAEALQAPVLYTSMGKGSISEDHPLCCGYSRPHGSWRLVKDSDCLIALGARFTDLSTENWEGSPRGLIHINVDAAEERKKFQPDVMVVGDARLFLVEILRRLEIRPYQPDPEWQGTCAAARKGRQEKQSRPLVHLFDFRELRQALPADGIVCTDVCLPGYAMVADFPVLQPRTFLAPSLFLAMGYGLPAALGAKAAFPDRQVISVSGNGGFLMTCAELGSARHNGLHVVSIVVNDGIYGTIRRMQNEQYGGRHMGIRLQDTDFMKLAGAFDVPGIRVTRKDQFGAALQQALESKGPYLIEVRVP